MKSETAIIMALLGYNLTLQACSVGMAASGHEKQGLYRISRLESSRYCL
ncbi:MAG: hypothetical protein HYZ72_12525 [Deltaproteobacteria bacterium]|nr:hypothetical protein [Deltaproteobacteria bacterium]